ncbi:hypothetical protein CRUP_017260 [Coryphaenoides rupestris]|nr:hypothetical protein CRUP_017260 [Coryphaenoides rupestris]
MSKRIDTVRIAQHKVTLCRRACAGPGISSYASNPQGAGESLKECLLKAEQLVPSSRHGETPLYLGATAGMRLLKGGKIVRFEVLFFFFFFFFLLRQLSSTSRMRAANAVASDDVFKEVEQALDSYPFSFRGARILSGQEEGAFGWGHETTGALDLGGASTQISFVSDRFDGAESPDNLMTFRLYGNDYNLYTHSFLCYGKDQALLQTLARQTQVGIEVVAHAHCCCGSPGGQQGALEAIPCVADRKPATSPANFSLSGTGDFEQCQALIKRVFDLSRPCVADRKPATSPANFSLSGTGDFEQCQALIKRAFSAYYFVLDFLNLTDTTLPLETVKGRLKDYCATPWSQLQKQNPKIKVKYLAEYCFSGTYILTLLTEGYNFTAETFKDKNTRGDGMYPGVSPVRNITI